MMIKKIREDFYELDEKNALIAASTMGCTWAVISSWGGIKSLLQK